MTTPTSLHPETKAGQWAYDIHIDGALYCGVAGYENQFDSMDGAQEAGALVDNMQLVFPLNS